MQHPTAGDPVGAEVWESADGFYEGKLHWVLGQAPSWVECGFHAGTDRVFPWTRVKASDELGIISIYRFDQVTEEFSDRGRVWKAYGRCSIYGATDNYLRSPRIYTQTGAVDPDSGYEEWEILGPDRLKSCEEVLRLVGDEHNGLYVTCLAAPTYPATGYTFKTDAERDVFLETQVAESAYATTPEKIGPNYVNKGVRRGWVFKDIFRHTAGKHNSASRPVLAVYNRSLALHADEDEGTPINSNFSQAQAGGAGANALARDVAISWPWKNSATPDSGYDYRTVWPGNTESYSPSGQAVEIARRGDFEWDDDQCIGNEPGGQDGKITEIAISASYHYVSNDPFCPDDFFEFSIETHIGLFTSTPSSDEICAMVPAPHIGLGIHHPVCTFNFAITLEAISVDVHFGVLSGLCCPNPFSCEGWELDFFETIGGGPTNCFLSCGVPTQLFWSVPSSSCPDFDFLISECADDDEVFSNPNITKIPLISPPPCGTPIGAWEVLIDGSLLSSRVRAMGMGMNNAGGDQTATLPGAEDIWNPEQNQFHIRRELIVNDYGITEGPELLNLARGYLPLPNKKFGGFTIAKLYLWGLLRAGSTAPLPNKILQAGDRVQIGRGIPTVPAGFWLVDEIEYAFPEGMTTLTISQRPAALVGGPQSNIRTLGESAAGQGRVFESEWFHVLEPRFKAGSVDQNEPGLYDLFSFDHYLGTIPQSIIIIAAKQKIFNWFDDVAVTAAQPLYVPEGNLFDHTQVQGVGYDRVSVNEQSIHFQFRRYLFYDDIDGKWVYPTERVLKVWIMP